MAEYLLRNDVKLKQLTKDVTIHGKTYKKGSIVVDMHQAKRNMANSALYSNMVIDTWDAPLLRAFDGISAASRIRRSCHYEGWRDQGCRHKEDYESAID